VILLFQILPQKGKNLKLFTLLNSYFSL